MTYVIHASGSGPVDDDLRAAFGDLVRALRATTPDGQAGPTASLSTGSATYTEADIPDDDPADDDPGEEA